MRPVCLASWISVLFCVVSLFADSIDPENLQFFEGDMVGIFVRPNQDKLPNEVNLAAPSLSAKKWPNGIVPYTFDPNYGKDAINMVESALKYFMKSVNLDGKHCIKFVKRTNETDYVNVFDGPGCFSRVGNVGSMQNISLNTNGCLIRGTIVHEFLHTLGFFHEQSRPDRDDFVTIIKENVIDDITFTFNFQKYSTDEVFMGGPYDYGSVMHYQALAFSKNGRPTIIPKHPGVKIGQREGLSPIDISEVRKYYGCGSKNDEISWNYDSNLNLLWAHGCDFTGNNLKNVQSRRQDCAKICRKTVECTHFTYNFATNTCNLRNNAVDKSRAFRNDPAVSACGYLLSCTDDHVKCQFWAITGECQTDPEFMLHKCCNSCKNSVCEDRHPNCEFWTSRKECERNPNFMLRDCCKSCKIKKKLENFAFFEFLFSTSPES